MGKNLGAGWPVVNRTPRPIGIVLVTTATKREITMSKGLAGYGGPKTKLLGQNPEQSESCEGAANAFWDCASLCGQSTNRNAAVVESDEVGG